jgi:hypothetical protein
MKVQQRIQPRRGVRAPAVGRCDQIAGCIVDLDIGIAQGSAARASGDQILADVVDPARFERDDEEILVADRVDGRDDMGAVDLDRAGRVDCVRHVIGGHEEERLERTYPQVPADTVRSHLVRRFMSELRPHQLVDITLGDHPLHACVTDPAHLHSPPSGCGSQPGPHGQKILEFRAGKRFFRRRTSP